MANIHFPNLSSLHKDQLGFFFPHQTEIANWIAFDFPLRLVNNAYFCLTLAVFVNQNISQMFRVQMQFSYPVSFLHHRQ